jgi:hypothetical protein
LDAFVNVVMPGVAKLSTSDDAKDRRPRYAALADVRACTKEKSL